MKQTNIQITFEEEKLRALRRYIAKRDSTLEAELQKACLLYTSDAADD